MEQDIPDPRVRIVSRERWGALPPKFVEPLSLPAHRLFFMHTDTTRCMSRKECYKELRELQKSYMDQGMPDLPFSFLIGGDLRIYEGRGWGVRIRRRDVWEWNDDRVVIALITPQRIKVDDKNANKMMWRAYALMYEGVEKNKLVDFDKHRFQSAEDIANEKELLKREYRKMKKEEEEERIRKQRVAEHFEKEGCEGQTQDKEETEKEKEERENRERQEKEMRIKELEAQEREEKEKEKQRKENREHPLYPRRKVTLKDLFRSYLEHREKKEREKKAKQGNEKEKEREKEKKTETKE